MGWDSRDDGLIFLFPRAPPYQSCERSLLDVGGGVEGKRGLNVDKASSAISL